MTSTQTQKVTKLEQVPTYVILTSPSTLSALILHVVLAEVNAVELRGHRICVSFANPNQINFQTTK